MTTMWAAALLVLAQDAGKGSIQGRISPEVSVRIVAVRPQQDVAKPQNVKGEATLEKAGAFEIKGLAPGTYTLHFQLQGADAGKYLATYWSEIEVKAGQATEEIVYRLTPAGATHVIDEVLVQFEDGVPAAARAKAVKELGCRLKERAALTGIWRVAIPERATVDEVRDAFRKVPGVKFAERNGIGRIP